MMATRGYRIDAHPIKLNALLDAHESPRYIIAARAGIHPARLSQYALGKWQIIPRHLIALCTVLGVGPEDVLGEEGGGS